ncbi:MAG: YqaJ viral recombinase family protein [Alicyclobacillus macrosporangiidus]|uniref:YqaJ viral recombinase family nuclease n=1 Tax=Alicyclobacillus macrosporangiidus TaxID=392015 RepID=UPI0026EB36AA|nr:YqaJ viral recombinase family protein [Alicyclobacillus macrosporangiidus]MCL6599542.1 YqaJ viral recombinase family protein [Alicyclobacillus macrosporangiidus]
MAAEVLVSTRDMSREAWLQARTQGIGGSDVAAIAGLSRWKSPVQVYLEKIGEAQPEEAGEAAYWGTVLEDVVAAEFTRRTGLKVRRRNAILRHPEYPWMIANVDRLVVGQEAGLECKTASEYLRDEWVEDRIPDAYMLQVQHYMAVTGLPKWWIAVLIGGNKFVHKCVERDDTIIQCLIDLERDFWNNHVVPKIPPAFDGSEASTELLSALYPTSKPGTAIELPPDAEKWLRQYEEAAADEKAASERKEEAANQLKALLADNEVGWIGDRKVTWKSVSSMRFDTKAFKEQYPDLYTQFAKPSESRRFTVK